MAVATPAEDVGPCGKRMPPAHHRPVSTLQKTTTRVSAVDTLRTGLVAWIIAGHALLGYSAVGGWPYDEINEVTLAPGTELVMAAVIGPSGLFVIGVLFFTAGLFTPGSLERRGPVSYARARLLRLGVPWAIVALLVWPLFLWMSYQAAGRDVAPWWVVVHRQPVLDSGSLWFALVLLLFSLAYTGWRVWRGARPRPLWDPLRPASVVGLVLVMAVTTFVLRVVVSARSAQPGDLHVWQWPQCAGMFLFGIAVANGPRTWSFPPRVVGFCGGVVVALLVLFPAVALLGGVSDAAAQSGPFLGGWHVQALATAFVESILVVCGSIALVGLAARRFDQRASRVVRWNRAAFAAFVLQGPVLLTLATAARPLPWPAEAKAPLVGLAAVVACFALGHLLVTRTALRRWLS